MLIAPTPRYQPEKSIESQWDSFRRGLNKLLRDTELQKEEVKEAQNVILVGKGILTPRPGTGDYYQADTSGKVRGLLGVKFANETNELLAVTDAGYLTKKNGNSYTRITGVSFASGYPVEMAMIYDKVYICNGDRTLVKYDGSGLTEYAQLSTPTGLTATKSSGTSGTFKWSWRVTAESQVGETLASNPVVLENLPEELSTTNYVTLSWTAVSAASGVLKGYVIYGREPGDETYLARVAKDVTTWIDDGSNVPSDIAFPPDADTTGGPIAKYIIVHKEKLVLANIKGSPSMVMWSGGGPYIDRFHWSMGGGAKDIDKDNGEVITGITESPEGKIIVFKERSIYQLTLSFDSSLGIVVPTVTKISGAIGALSHRTIKIVENGIFFAGRRAGSGVSLNSLDYEPNILANVLRTAEISARIRPLLEGINMERIEEMHASYYDTKYYWFVPIGATQMRCLIYDRERLAFTGWHTFPNNPACSAVYYDSEGKDHLLYGDGDDGYVTEISKSYLTDKGTPFECIIQLPKEVFGDSYRLKNLLDGFVNFKNPRGTISINIYTEGKDGLTSSSKSITLEGQNPLAGWGSFNWGRTGAITARWSWNPSTMSQGASDIIKYFTLSKSNIRSVYLEIKATGAEFEFLGAKLMANYQGIRSIPAQWRA